MRHAPSLFAIALSAALVSLASALQPLPGARAVAADLAQTLPAPPPFIVDTGNLCTIQGPGGSVEVFEEPRGEVWGNLPNGMLVEVMDAPFSRHTDLWVRIKPPRVSGYYGWVETSTFVCV